MRADAPSPSLILSADGLLEQAGTSRQCIVHFEQHCDGDGRCWLEATFDGVPREDRPLPRELVAWWSDGAFPEPGDDGGGRRLADVTALDGTAALSPLREGLRRRWQVDAQWDAMREQRERIAAMRAWLDGQRRPRRPVPYPVEAMAAD